MENFSMGIQTKIVQNFQIRSRIEIREITDKRHMFKILYGPFYQL